MPGFELYGFDNATGENVSEPASVLINRVPVIAGGTTRTIGEHLAYANALVTKTATAVIPPWCAVIADGLLGCRPADPANPAHCGAVIGVAAEGAANGQSVVLRYAGDLVGPTGTFAASKTLWVGAGGVLAEAPLAGNWQQSVGTSTATDRIVVTLDAPRRIRTGGGPITLPPITSLVDALTPEVMAQVLAAFRASLPTAPPAGSGLPWNNGNSIEWTP